MDIIQTIVLAIIQGLTEVLPISSSAHLILVSQLADWADQGTAIDVALHIGTLLSVLYYFFVVVMLFRVEFFYLFLSLFCNNLLALRPAIIAPGILKPKISVNSLGCHCQK